MVNKEKNFVSAIIYVHNAQERIMSFLDGVISIFEDNFEHSEVICVNDCSEDESATIIKERAGKVKNTSLTVINMSHYHGLELAMDAGMDLSIGDFVFEFDNTIMDYTPQLIMEVYRRALLGYDIVSASPNKEEKITSRLFYNIFDKFSDNSYEMGTESFRVLSRRVINRVSSMNKTIPYRKAVYANCGLKTDNIKYPVQDVYFKCNDPKEKNYRTELAIDTLILFTNVGYSFAKCMTVLMMFVSIFMIAYSIVIYAMAHPVAGWTTTILFLSVAFLGLFGILTVIIKYLQLLINLEFKRKHYNYESIEKLTK